MSSSSLFVTVQFIRIVRFTDSDLALTRIFWHHGEMDSAAHRVHRVATAAFWRTFNREGKISPGGEGTPTPFHYTYHHQYVAVYAPAEWADTLTLFHLY
jgi:hypothetical protein